MDKSSSKFKIIHDVLQDKQNVLSVNELCNIACVSRSGYYNWVKSESKRIEKEKKIEKILT